VSPVEIVSLPDSRGRRLKVEFSRDGDRFQHQVSLVDGQRQHVLLSSVEGDEHASWPPSPPLQQVTAEEGPQGSGVLLLVGMAGRSHWSVSVEAAPSAAAVILDVACRMVGECGRLRSHYRCESPPRLSDDALAADFQFDDQTCRLVSEPPGNQVAATIESTGQTLRLIPPDAVDELPTTVRWKYRIEIL
jgi:hypothetical protein